MVSSPRGRVGNPGEIYFGTKLEHSRPACYMWITGDREGLRDRLAYRVGSQMVPNNSEPG